MYKHYYFDKNLLITSIGGTMPGVQLQPVIPINYPLEQSAPTVAAKVKQLLQSHKVKNAIFQNETPLYNLGSFSLVFSGESVFFNLWKLCEEDAPGGNYLLESSNSPDYYSIENVNADVIDNIEVNRFREVAKLSSIGILQVDDHWRTLYASKAWSQATGYGLIDIAEREWIHIFHKDDKNRFFEKLHKDVTNERNSEQDVRLKTIEGDYRWYNIHYRVSYDLSNHCRSIIMVFIDIHNKREQHENLKRIAMKDLLTQIGNRYAFQEKLESSIKKIHSSESFYLIFLDLDGFKAVNDAYGHVVGDKLLQSVAKRLDLLSGNSSFVARLGGDEFAIILRKSSTPDVTFFADILLAEISKPYSLVKGAQESYVSASMGIVHVKPKNIGYSDTLRSDKVKEIAGQLLRQADSAMYDSKASGRNTYRFYAAELDDQTRKKLLITDALHRALEKDEFYLHYQPQWSCNSDSIYGYEALIRWDSVAYDMGPEFFIPLVEANGLMGHVGKWVFNKALSDHAKVIDDIRCADIDNASKLTLPQLSVNFSPIQFRDQKLFSFIKTTLEKHNVPAYTVTIEITENLLNSDFIEISEQLTKIKELGVLIALDDFGTGYSSLSSLYQFPIDIIKIDKQFVADLHVDDIRHVVAAILRLSNALNKKILVEGVETEEQLEYLKKEGADIIQGWLVSKAIPLADIKEFTLSQKMKKRQGSSNLMESVYT